MIKNLLANYVLSLATFSLLCSIAYPAFAQKVDEEAIKTQFPEAEVVFLQKKEHLKINYDEGEWDILKKVHEDQYFLDNSQQLYGEKSIFYSSFEEVTRLDAETLVPIKKGRRTKYESKKVTKVETEDMMMGGIFYSDYKRKKVVFPAVQKGAITKLAYTEVTHQPYLLSGFYFGQHLPVLTSTYSVSFPEQVTITHKLLGENTDHIRFEEKKENGVVTYTWIAENLAAVKGEAGAPSSSYYEPHVVIHIAEVQEKGKKKAVLKDVGDLYNWYYSLVDDVNKTGDETLKKVVQELIEGVEDDVEKAKRIYQWVQNNIKYVAFEDGMGGFIPRKAKDVCQKKYGDCKDMSNIIVEMLNMAKIPAYLTWIGTRDKPYSYKDVPTPIADNHMIAAAKLNGQTVFLDATGEYLPFGLPTSMIQGKEALIGIDKDNYEVIKVPVIPKEANQQKETIELSIDGRNLVGKARSTWTGYKKVFAEYGRMRFEKVEEDRFFTNFLSKGGNNFTITDRQEKGFYDRDHPIEIDYSFVVPNYVKKVGSKLYVNLNLKRKYSNATIDLEKRKLDREQEHKYIESNNFALTIPEGYQVDYLPESSQYEGDLFGYEINYEEKEGKIMVQQTVYSDYLILKKRKFKDWNKMMEQLGEAYQEVVVLKKAE